MSITKLPEAVWQNWKKSLSISTDTRKIKPGDVFFALKGDNFNGNLFAKQALESGASMVVVDEPTDFEDNKVVQVENSLRALQSLASEWRNLYNYPVVGISGSNGKTTTKELLRSIFETRFRTLSTQGNLNNHIGVPLTLLKLHADLDVAIIELGANKPGDIQELVEIARPNFGLMTNVGYTHLDGMGSLEGVEKTEGELYHFLAKNNGLAFVNELDAGVVRQAHSVAKKITYAGPNSDFRIKEWRDSWQGMELNIESNHWELSLTIKSALNGKHNALNILAACAVANHFGLSHEEIQKGIQRYVPVNNRSQWIEQSGKKILLDAYNANPSSMEVSVQSFLDLNPEAPALILGDMFELGEMSKTLHSNMGKFLQKVGKETRLILVGNDMKNAADQIEGNVFHYASTPEAMKNIHADLRGIKTILIKGSRGMALEKLLDAI